MKRAFTDVSLEDRLLPVGLAVAHGVGGVCGYVGYGWVAVVALRSVAAAMGMADGVQRRGKNIRIAPRRSTSLQNRTSALPGPTATQRHGRAHTRVE